MSSTADYLRISTRSAHDQTEQLLEARQIMDGTFSPSQYKRLIGALHQVWAAAHNWIATIDNPLPAGPDLGFISSLYKSLADDAERAGHHHPLQLAIDLDPKDLANQYGLAYVLEGSTLGGRIIHQKLLHNQFLSPFAPFAFYSGCAQMPKGHWKDFSQAINAVLTSEVARDHARQAANYTFNLIQTALEDMDEINSLQH